MTSNINNLENAKLNLHYCALILASTAHSLIEHKDDDSHTCLYFNKSLNGFKTDLLFDDYQVAIQINSLTLLISKGSDTIEELSLGGKTLADAFNWLNDKFKSIKADTAVITQRTYDDFPQHEIGSNGSFDSAIHGGLSQLGSQYYLAFELLSEISSAHKEASIVQTWPHHFDMATLLTFNTGDTKYIGAGFSPGDVHIKQPYYYVNPFPFPEKNKLQELDSLGEWYTRGFNGIVLPYDKIETVPDKAIEIKKYLNNSIAVCKNILQL